MKQQKLHKHETEYVWIETLIWVNKLQFVLSFNQQLGEAATGISKAVPFIQSTLFAPDRVA